MNDEKFPWEALGEMLRQADSREEVRRILLGSDNFQHARPEIPHQVVSLKISLGQYNWLKWIAYKNQMNPNRTEEERLIILAERTGYSLTEYREALILFKETLINHSGNGVDRIQESRPHSSGKSLIFIRITITDESHLLPPPPALQ